jgi:hypothetical protein
MQRRTFTFKAPFFLSLNPFPSLSQPTSLDAQCSHSLTATAVIYVHNDHLINPRLAGLVSSSHLRQPKETTNNSTIKIIANMPNHFAIRAILGVTFACIANAHMKMAFPVPFDVANLDTSPLQASGSDYPCKKSSYKITAMNKIPVNEAVLLDFNGTAIHEGGTCELSISLDKEPTADSVFKVIQVFEGGCPTVQGTGGLTFNIPKEFPSTERATLAWTWFNRIGNRGKRPEKKILHC